MQVLILKAIVLYIYTCMEIIMKIVVEIECRTELQKHLCTVLFFIQKIFTVIF